MHPPDEPRHYPDREGKKQVSAFVTVEKWRTLRNVATNTQRTATDLLTEAIDVLAEKYADRPPADRPPADRPPRPRQRDRSPR